ncbi:unnamed protein product [Closterium sp. NIES-54]
MSASGPVAAPCSCRLLSHQTLRWHHRLGHPSLPRLCGMHSYLLLSGLPRSLPPLLPSPAPPCIPCVEGRQHAAPHSSFPPTTAPLQTHHMDVWGPARVSGQDRERYFLLVVDDYTRYTTVFPLRSKGEVPYVLIPWIHAVRLQVRERFREDLPNLRLHSVKIGEFSSDLLRGFCRGEGILQSFTLPASPQKNEVAERRIGLVIEVARTSMIYVAAPNFLWPFVVRYAAHQLNLWPRSCSLNCVSGRPTPPGFTYRVAVDSGAARRAMSRGAASRSAEPGVAEPEGAEPVGAESEGAESKGVEPKGAEPGDSGAARRAMSGGAASRSAEPGVAEPEGAEPVGAESEGAESKGVEPKGAEPGGTEPKGAKHGGVESEGAESGGAEPRGTASAGGPARRLATTVSPAGTSGFLGAHALGVALRELEALLLEALELEVLELLVLEVPELLLELISIVGPSGHVS